MELNKKLWHAIFYKMSFRELPQSFCEYFWKLTIALLLLPITFIGYLIKPIRVEDYLAKVYSGLLFWIIFICIPLSVQDGNPNLSFLDCLGIVLGLTMGFFIVIIGVMYIFYKLDDIKNNRSCKTKKPSLIKTKWQSFKDKYCPQIKWK